MTKLAVIVHENDEVTLKDERGLPFVCKDCRFAGWLTEHEFKEHPAPCTCLHFSGGANPREGVRVILLDVTSDYGHYRVLPLWRARYPLCSDKNADGNCSDFVRARPLTLSWWEMVKSLSPKFRSALRRRMRT